MSAKERLIGDVDLILIPAFPASERRVMTMVLNRYPEVLGGIRVGRARRLLKGRFDQVRGL
jgi:hypothetical protein